MESKQLLTTSQAAERLNVSPKHVRRLHAEAGLKGVRLGRVLRFTEEALEDFISNNSR